jgi:hypothetical protein
MHTQARQRTIEIRITRTTLYLLSALVILAGLVGLGALGRAYTPDPARVVGWGDWQALKMEVRYARELRQLSEDLETLATMLQADPDPVRAEMAATRIQQRHSEGVGLLEQQRAAVILAAQHVRNWAAGYAEYDEALATINTAIEIVAGNQQPSPRLADPGQQIQTEETGYDLGNVSADDAIVTFQWYDGN